MTVLTSIALFLALVLLVITSVVCYSIALWLRRRTAEEGQYKDSLELGTESQRLDLERQRQLVERERLATEREKLDIDRQRLAITEKIYPDPSTGQYPLLWDGQNLLDADRGMVLTIPDGVVGVTPGVTVPEQKARLLRAGGGWPPATGSGSAMLEGPQAVNWPSRVPLRGLINGSPSYRALVLGVTVTPNGPEVVKADMSSLVHVAVAGSSGWGKSVFLRALAYQLAKSSEPVGLAMVDLEGATLAPFAHCDCLLWPIADTEIDALAIFSELTKELDRRKALFAKYPGVDSLEVYNTVATEPLSPVICLVDEATALLGDKEVENALRTLTLRARKFGLWCVLAGQDWKATSLDTAIRNQLATRVQFKAMSPSQSRVLLQQAGAETLDAKGRALAWLPGRELTEIQAPFVGRQDILDAFQGKGPRRPMPESSDGGQNNAGHDGDNQRINRIVDLYYQGMKPTPIAREVYGYVNSDVVCKVREIIREHADDKSFDDDDDEIFADNGQE
jgi:hypothetical protein